MQAAARVLAPDSVEELNYEGSLDEFGQRLCDTMATYGASHINSLGTRDKKVLLLQQVQALLAHLLHPDCCIHYPLMGHAFAYLQLGQESAVPSAGADHSCSPPAPGLLISVPRILYWGLRLHTMIMFSPTSQGEFRQP